MLLTVGCSQSPTPSAPRRHTRKLPPADPLQFGRQVYERYGCALCHGDDGKSGIRNANAKTAEKIPSVVFAADSYKPEELKQLIRRGQPNIDKMHPDGPPPPFKMPSYGAWINEPELAALQKYLFSLMPKNEEEKF
jgi:mono/diheme cytochrome c family protein